MPTEKAKVGKTGEELAVSYLKKKHYSILERNFRRPWGELDIVAKKGDVLVFIEVKTLVKQAGEYQLQPEDEFTYHKAQKLQKAIVLYFKERRIDLNHEWRADLIAIDLNPDCTLSDLRHIENILFEF